MLSKTVLLALVPLVVGSPLVSDPTPVAEAVAYSTPAPQPQEVCGYTSEVCDCRYQCAYPHGATNIIECTSCLDICEAERIYRSAEKKERRQMAPPPPPPSGPPAGSAPPPSGAGPSCDCNDKCGSGKEAAGDIIMCLSCVEQCHSREKELLVNAHKAKKTNNNNNNKQAARSFYTHKETKKSVAIGPFPNDIDPAVCEMECDTFCSTAKIAISMTECTNQCKTPCYGATTNTDTEQQKNNKRQLPFGPGALGGGAAGGGAGGAGGAPGGGAGGAAGGAGGSSGASSAIPKPPKGGSTAGDIVQCACATDCMHTFGSGLGDTMDCAMDCLVKCPTPGANQEESSSGDDDDEDDEEEEDDD